MPNSGQEGEFKSPVGFVDTKSFYQPPPQGGIVTPAQPVDMADYLEHQFDESNPPS